MGSFKNCKSHCTFSKIYFILEGKKKNLKKKKPTIYKDVNGNIIYYN